MKNIPYRGTMEFSNKSLVAFVLILSTNFICQSQEKGFQSLIGGAPEDIQELACCFKNNYVNDLNVKFPTGILIVGQSGMGKTKIAKALSEEIHCPFIYKKASELDADEIKKLFRKARTEAQYSFFGKTIIFIDDFHVFGSNNNNGNKGSETRDNVLALMNEIDGFEKDESVIVIAASNSIDNFDQSLVRSGRFEKIIELTYPNPEQRELLMKKFNEECKIKFNQNLDFKNIVNVSYNFTPADIKQLINNATTYAKKENSNIINENHLYQGIIQIFNTKLKYHPDQKVSLLIRTKVITDLLKKNKDEKKGYARLVGEIPDEIKVLVEQIKNDSKYKTFNLDLPKGILLLGPPGTGKTSLVRALSEEAGCEFMATSGSEFVDPMVGGGSKKIRELFKEARQKAANSISGKTILFIDEIDSIGKRQGNALDSTITELLTQMDGFEEDDSIIVIAASNHPENLDTALLRPGRFSKSIKIGLPDLEKRELLLNYYTKNIPLASDVNIKKIAQATNNFSPADLKELIQKSSALAIKEKSLQINEKYLVEGIKKSLNEKILKGEKNIQQLIDSLDVIFNNKETTKGFKRIAGGVEPEIEDLVKMIKGEFDYSKFGLPFPKGILLAGPPGTGKTALVRALSEEAGCEFIQAKGSDFIEKFVGVGAQRVRDLFNEARSKSEGNRFGKTIIFIDELDAIGSRSTSDNSETQRTITELLTQMDGFYKDESVIVIGATNTPASLDQALLRAGRFDTIIEVALPNLTKRKALFEYYGKNRPIDSTISFDKLAQNMEGCNAADIKNLIDKAAQIAMRSKDQKIKQNHFDQALNDIKKADNRKKISYV